ncbi:MAG: hotdog domain-containing protein [bacterium]|nr:hotdog domain-containing protein [bacterium]
MSDQPIQNFYGDDVATCYGCGRNNQHGLHVRTFWNGEEGIAHFTPQPYHIGYPGVVYGGLLASIIDCHSIATAVAAMYDREKRTPGSDPIITCVTAQLNVYFRKPTPIGAELTLTATAGNVSKKKADVLCVLTVNDIHTVSAEVVAVRTNPPTTSTGRGRWGF